MLSTIQTRLREELDNYDNYNDSINFMIDNGHIVFLYGLIEDIYNQDFKEDF